MPAHLEVRPSLDEGLAVWRAWWDARQAWRVEHLPPGAGGWLSDVASYHQEKRRCWADEGRAGLQ